MKETKQNNMTLKDLNKMDAREFNQLSLDEIKQAFANYRNSDEAKAKEEYAASLPSNKVAVVKMRNLADINSKHVVSCDLYEAVKLNHDVLNSFIWWNDTTSNRGQVWIKPDMVDAFKQANPQYNVVKFDTKVATAMGSGATDPYIGGGLVTGADEVDFTEMLDNIIAA